MRRKRIKEQEAEIALLKKQLGGGGLFGGRTGGRATGHGVPPEYLCPITQVDHSPLSVAGVREAYGLSNGACTLGHHF